jgi:hypothetical protein
MPQDIRHLGLTSDVFSAKKDNLPTGQWGRAKKKRIPALPKGRPGNLPRVALKSDLRRAGYQAERLGTGLGRRYLV